MRGEALSRDRGLSVSPVSIWTSGFLILVGLCLIFGDFVGSFEIFIWR